MLPKFLRWIFIKYNYKNYKSQNYNGELSINGIREKAKIYRDKWGVPNIYAESDEDMFFCQGYVHAQDRIWQMELNRRTGNGSLAEVFGNEALNTDRLTRTLGFNRLAKKDLELLSLKDKLLLEAYSRGINSWMRNNKLPIEFKLANICPKKWSILDSLSWSRVLTWTLSHGWSSAITRQEIINKVGDEMASELSIFYPQDNPIEIPDILNDINTEKFMDSKNGPFLTKDLEGGGRGSNAWVISDFKSKTKRPILCNDTHLILNTPGIWYLNHLHSKQGYHCTGASIAGFPGILIGHNENIGWGITLAYTDVEDIFIEKEDITNSEKYEYCGEFNKFIEIKEVIKVKGKNEHIEKIRQTIHGPLIGSIIKNSSYMISLCSKSIQENTIISGFFEINYASNWTEFTKGVEKIKAPQLNIIYADIEKNIGLYVSGRVPIRKNGNGDTPKPGWTGEYDWVSEIPHESMPNILNPKCGFIISCNNKIVDNSYPYYLGNSFMNGYRASRIERKIIDTSKIDIKSVKAWQMDTFSIPGERIKVGLIKNFITAKPKAQKCIDIINKWDCYLDENSIGGTVYQVFLYQLTKNIIKPHLGKKLTEKYLGIGEHPILLPVNELLGHSTEAIIRIFKNSNSKWLPSKKLALSIIENSLVESCKWLEKNMGEDPYNWKWGIIHQAEFKHSFSIKKPLNEVFNIGPFPIGGDTDTVHQSAYNPSSPYHCTSWSPSNRFVMDIGNWDACIAISPPGQSGVVGSKHYDDMVKLWKNGEYIFLPWSQRKVKETAEDILVIKP